VHMYVYVVYLMWCRGTSMYVHICANIRVFGNSRMVHIYEVYMCIHMSIWRIV